MSTCISSHGEYSEHVPGEEPFVCGRCFTFDEDAAKARITELEAECEALVVAGVADRINGHYEPSSVLDERDALARRVDELERARGWRREDYNATKATLDAVREAATRQPDVYHEPDDDAFWADYFEWVKDQVVVILDSVHADRSQRIDPAWKVQPPEGWSTFGTHANDCLLVETWGEEFSEDGLPIWERPADRLNTVKAEVWDEGLLVGQDPYGFDTTANPYRPAEQRELIPCPHWNPGSITMRKGCTACEAGTEQGEQA